MKDLFRFLISKAFFKQLLFVAIFLALVLAAVLFWLDSYTNHGQKIQLQDFANLPYSDAASEAREQSFQLIISDSIHIVGRPGGIVLDQNPDAGSMVKENRKVYVTTTKYNPDQIKVGDLPLLYGTDYDQAVADLKSRSIFSEVKSRKYDAGQPNHILEVWYNGKKVIDGDNVRKDLLIEKGATLQFVISDRAGGLFAVPKLVCRQLSDAQSYMLYSKLKLGDIKQVGDIDDLSSAWVVSQYPPANSPEDLPEGSTITISVSEDKPTNCN